MAKLLYRYRGGIDSFTMNEVVIIRQKLEESLRSGSISYVNRGISSNQRTGIKNDWPADMRTWINLKIKETCKDERPTPTQLEEAVRDVLIEKARERARFKVMIGNKLSWAMPYEMKLFSADFVMSNLFDQAPLFAPKSYIRTFDKLAVKTQASERPVRLVVDCDQIDEAHVYLLGLYDANLKECILLGWAGKKEVKVAPKGNQDTDQENCKWKKMSHYIAYHDIRPMVELLKKLSITKVPAGILFENPPAEGDIPYFSHMRSEDSSRPDPGDDYEKSILGEDTQPSVNKDPKVPVDDVNI